MNEPTDREMTAWAREIAERRERLRVILESSFVVGVELRPSGFVRRDWMVVRLEDGTIIHGEVYRERPIIRSIQMKEMRDGRMWSIFDELSPGSELDRMAHAVVMEGLRAHAGAARRREVAK